MDPRRRRPVGAALHGRSYINFQTADADGAEIRDSYGPNFRRVAEIKRAYDPENLFRVNRNVVTAAADGRS